MAALANKLPGTNADHVYDAKAYVFSAALEQPIHRIVDKAIVEKQPNGHGTRRHPTHENGVPDLARLDSMANPARAS